MDTNGTPRETAPPKRSGKICLRDRHFVLPSNCQGMSRRRLAHSPCVSVDPVTSTPPRLNTELEDDDLRYVRLTCGHQVFVSHILHNQHLVQDVTAKEVAIWRNEIQDGAVVWTINHGIEVPSPFDSEHAR